MGLNRLLPGLDGHTVAVALQPCEPGQVAGNPLEQLRWFERNLPNEELFPVVDRCVSPPGELLTFAHLGRRHGIDLHDIDHINEGDGYALLKSYQPDVVLSLRFGLILKQRAIAMSRLGVLNVHPGALPQYAGVLAPMRAIQAGERTLSCTLHVIDQGIDTGPVIDSRDMAVDPERSMSWHALRLYPLGAEMFLRILPVLEAGRLPDGRAQDRARRQYYSTPTSVELRSFLERGFHLVDATDFQDVVRMFAGGQPSSLDEIRRQVEPYLLTPRAT